MKSKIVAGTLGALMMTLMVGWLVTGCSTPQVDWNSRIGNYTMAQAKADLGTPTESRTLSDGNTSAEWLKRMGTPGPAYTGMETGPRAGGVEEPGGLGPQANSQSEYLRLIFDANGKLVKWEDVHH